LSVCIALLRLYEIESGVNRAVLGVDRALLSVHRALLSARRAVLNVAGLF